MQCKPKFVVEIMQKCMLRNVLEGWQGKKCRLRPVLFSLTGPQVNL
jgi:hypothetical protein